MAPIAQGEKVMLQVTFEQESLGYMLHFDGSHHKDQQVGGAGVALFRIRPGFVEYVLGLGIALPHCVDNVAAETKAVSRGIEALVSELVNTHNRVDIWHMPIYVQGDIVPIICFLVNHGRVWRLDIIDCLEPAQYTVALWFRSLRLCFVPREANIIADHFAGKTMRFAFFTLSLIWRCLGTWANKFKKRYLHFVF